MRTAEKIGETADKLTALYLALHRSGLDNGQLFNRTEAEFTTGNGEGR